MIPLRTNFPATQVSKPIDHTAIKSSAFHEHGIVVINLKDPTLSWVDIEEAQRIGEKLFGRRDVVESRHTGAKA